MAVDLRLEYIDRAEPRDIKRHDEMAGVAGALVIGVEIHHLPAERSAGQHAGEKAQHQR